MCYSRVTNSPDVDVLDLNIRPLRDTPYRVKPPTLCEPWVPSVIRVTLLEKVGTTCSNIFQYQVSGTYFSGGGGGGTIPYCT